MLCNSSLTLGPVHLISNAQNKSFSHLLLAWLVISLITTLSSPGVMPPWPPSVYLAQYLFPLLLLSRMHIFSPKPSAWEIWGAVFTLTHSVHAFLQPCAPLSDDFLVQH